MGDEPNEKKKPRKVCGAKKKRGGFCQQSPIIGRRRCKFHGGRSVRGPAHYNYKDGRYSQYLPRSIHTQYAQACRDRNGNNLQDEIGVVTNRIGALLKEAYSNTTVVDFPGMKQSMVDLREAMNIGDVDKIRGILMTIDVAIEKGNEQSGHWKLILDTVEARRRLVDTQRKYDIDMGRMLPVAQAHQFMSTLGSIVKDTCEQHLKDGALARTICIQVYSKFQSIFAEPVTALPHPDS